VIERAYDLQGERIAWVVPQSAPPGSVG
jgi:hypothetical protein